MPELLLGEIQAEGQGLAGSVFLLSAISLGVGVFALPQVFALCGYGVGTGLLVLFAFLTYYTATLCLQLAERHRCGTYEELCREVLGRPGACYHATALAVTCFVGNAAHMQAASSMFADLMFWFVTDQPTTNSGEWHMEEYKKAVLTSVLLALVLPFTFQKSLTALSWVGRLSVLVVSLNVTLFVAYCCYLKGTDFVPGQDQPLAPVAFAQGSVADFFRAAGAVAFAFTPLLNLFPVVREMQNPKQAPRAVFLATLLCFAVYLCIALAGSLTFAGATQPNCIYNTLPEHRMPFRLPWLLLVICITLLYPVVNYPMVESVEFLVGRSAASRPVISSGGALGMVLVTFFVPDIVDLFGLCASLGLGSVLFVLPALLGLRSEGCRPHFLFVLVLGLLLTFVSTYFIVEHIVAQ